MLDASELLLRNTAHPRHAFLPLDFSIEQVLSQCRGGLVGHRQITDAYLLTLAVRSKRRFVTFDAGVQQLLATASERQAHVVTLQ